VAADKLLYGQPIDPTKKVNGYARNESYQSEPLNVVCDDAFVRLTKNASPVLSPINLHQWLDPDYSSDRCADLVLCDSIAVIQQVRFFAPSIYILAVVDHLLSADIAALLDAGADDIVTESDISSGRMALMFRQRYIQQAVADKHAAIGALTQTFCSASNLRELIDGVCNSLLSAFNAKHATVCKLNTDGKFTLLAEWQRTENVISRANFANVKLMPGSISQWCVENKQVGLVRRGVADERDSAAVQKIRNLLGIGSSVTLPLMHNDVVWGVLVLGKDNGESDFTDVELSLLEMLVAKMSDSILRQNLLDEIHFQAFHDNLTKLPNRLKFENTLSQIVSSDNHSQEKFALLFLDLDGFKSVNDNQGHSIGDELLRQVSKRLAGCLQDRDLLARMGGDEFAVLLRGVKSRDNALAIAMRLSEAVGQLFIINKYKLKIGVSIGLSFYPDNGETVDDLLRNADFAMYEAKADGKGSVRSFSQSMAEQYRKRISLEKDLLNAIDNQQFELFYQPKVDLVQGRVSGVEALLRWNHPELGFIAPNDFVLVAEEAGFITAIGNWVLNEAISQSARWSADGLSEVRMAVNISGPQFVLEDFVDVVLATLERHALTKVISTLNTLRDHGVSIAIDDFGRGYSSLSYLELLPLDCMKIDKVFVDKMISGNESYSLVNTIVTMARTFGLKVVAEGIENEDQLKKVSVLGCDCVQGYYFSVPVPASDIPTTIALIERQFDERYTPQLKAG